MGIGTVLGAVGVGLVGAGAHEDLTGEPVDGKKVYRLVGSGLFLLAWAVALIPASILTFVKVAKVKRRLRNRVRLLGISRIERRIMTRDCGVAKLANAPVDIFVHLRGVSRRGAQYLLRRATTDANGVVQVDLGEAMAEKWARKIGDHVRIRWKGKYVRVRTRASLAGPSVPLAVVLKPWVAGVGARRWKVVLGGARQPRIARLSLRCAGEMPLEVKVTAGHQGRLQRVYLRGLTVRPDAPALLREGRPLRVKCMPNQVLEVQLLARACCRTSVKITARLVSPRGPQGARPRPTHLEDPRR